MGDVGRAVGELNAYAEQLEDAVDLVHDMLAIEPELSGQEVLVKLRALADKRRREVDSVQADAVVRVDCANCKHPIWRLGDSRWEHVTGSVGCRAASFDRDGDWDDRFSKSLKATPPSSRS
ncbi:hypothetical protein [Amycolatopsis sp. WGS_07]|uniref:hypothetical protein n=1 Tax=Amycolatopsis sp. WGS_07 TaxID=3076764 RepID=UPI0038731ACF